MYILYSGGASENGGHLLIKDICAQSHECPLLSGLTVVTIHGSVRCRGDGSIPGRFDSQICIDPNRSSALIFHSKYVCGRKLVC